MVLFHLDMPSFRRKRMKKVQELFREKLPPFLMQVAIQSKCWRCSGPHPSDQNSWFEHGKDIQWSQVPAVEVSVPYLLPLNLIKENNQGPNLHLTETSHPPLFRNLFMHSRPSNSWFNGTGLSTPSEITRRYPLVIWEYLRCQGKTPCIIRELMCQCSCRLTNKHKQISQPLITNHLVVAACIVPSSNLQLWPQVGQLPRPFCVEHLTISFRTLKQKMPGDCDMSTASSKKNYHAGGKCKKMCQYLCLYASCQRYLSASMCFWN